MDLKRVVVTGLGALTPIGNTIQEYWQGLSTGVSGAAPITRFDASNFKTQFACELKNFDVNDWMDRKEARKMDPYAQYAMIAADETMRDSGLDPEKIDLARAGVVWRSEEHTSELQSRPHLVCRLLLEKKKNKKCDTSIHQT